MKTDQEQPTPTRGAPAGNANAAKDDGFDTVVRIRCRRNPDKARWVKLAREAGLDLSEWIRQRVNAAKK